MSRLLTVNRNHTVERPLPGVHVAQPKPGYRYSVDAFWLAGWGLELVPRGCALDLCTGSGIVPFLLAAHGLEATGVDIQPGWAELWAHSRAPRQPTLLLRDARALEGSYDLVTCNPPFQRAGTGPIPTGPLKAAAHIELNGTLLELHTAAMGLCTPSGWVVFVIPAARIPELPSPTRSARIDHLALCAWGPALAEPLQQLDRDQAERWVQRARSVSPGSGGTAP